MWTFDFGELSIEDFAIYFANDIRRAWGEALACTVSLMCHLDSAWLRSVSLIETAWQCETVAKLLGVWRARTPDRLPARQADSRRDV